jgi:hypothetical protein
MIERENIEGWSREQWLAVRKNFVNASEIGAVVGEGGYGSLAELYAEKKGLRPPKEDSGPMRGGRWGEPGVFEALAETYPEWKIKRAKVHVRCLGRRLACTPDGFAVAPDREGIGVVQAKWIGRTSFRDRWLHDPKDDIQYGDATPPAESRLQTLTEMMLNETMWGVLAVIIHAEYDCRLRLFDVERDPVTEDRIEYRTALFFREYLDPGIMPPYEPLRDQTLVKALYPQDDGTEIDLTGDNRAIALADDLRHTQAGLKRLEEQEASIKTELQAKLGDHAFGRLADGRRLSWRTHNRKGYTVKPSTFRVFRILEPRHVE